ncbi:RteC domain-containing protein [Parabacteroides goldsteinii]|uniref:RteC domain-containing protein n=1 Tax=Parabacteroides goldsteinii TaxID=328812 RepID=UPI001897622D|nr:RteC domain-containing protein [Parabacteroides goldsteinii]
MKEYINQLVQQVENTLADFEICECNIISDSLKIVHYLYDILLELREKVKDNEFENKVDEILFFKVQKPELLGRLIYFYKMYRIETQCPTGSNEVIKHYLNQELDSLTYFFNHNLDFYQYYRSNSTLYDEYYFLRGKKDIRLCTDSSQFDKDPKFSTGYDYKVAKIIANEMLRIYLNKRIIKLETGNQIKDNLQWLNKSPFRFTGKKVFLIELGYSLASSGDFNNGNIEIKEMMNFLSSVFHTDLGDYYAAYIAMKERKDRTAYLHHLIDSLIKRMNDDDMK